MIVMKFGGTSLQTSEAMRSAINIVNQRRDNDILVVASACGGATNQLLRIAEAAGEGDTQTVQGEIDALHTRHAEMCDSLLGATDEGTRTQRRIAELCGELQRLCRGIALLQECTPRQKAAALGYGEKLSTTLLAAGLAGAGCLSALVDATTIIRTDSNFLQAEPDGAIIRKRAQTSIAPLLNDRRIVVTQGFIGADAHGITTVLGRGAGDLSAALFAAALDAEELQIWTDVSGVYSADPRLAPEAEPVPRMTIAEAGELAYFGAKVLHPDTVMPAVERRIPVRILNTFKPADQGTLLTWDAQQPPQGIRAITLKRRGLLLNFAIRAPRMKTRFLAALYSEIDRRGLNVYAAQGTELHYTICTDQSPDVEELLVPVAEYAESSVDEASILCACGPNVLGSKEAIAAAAEFYRIVATFGAHLIQQSADNISLIAAVPCDCAQDALLQIHNSVVRATPSGVHGSQ